MPSSRPAAFTSTTARPPRRRRSARARGAHRARPWACGRSRAAPRARPRVRRARAGTRLTSTTRASVTSSESAEHAARQAQPLERRQARRPERRHQRAARPGEREPGQATEGGDQQGLGHELAREASAARAERRAHRELLASPRGPRQQQVRDVGAGDEQHARGYAQQQQERGARACRAVPRRAARRVRPGRSSRRDTRVPAPRRRGPSRPGPPRATHPRAGAPRTPR